MFSLYEKEIGLFMWDYRSLLDHDNFDSGTTNGWKIRNRDIMTEKINKKPVLNEVHDAADK